MGNAPIVWRHDRHCISICSKLQRMLQTCLCIMAYSWGILLQLTHWGRTTHICVGKLTIIGSDNGLSPGRRHAIIRTNAGILLIRPLRTNFSEFLVEILIVSFKKMRLKVSSAKRRPFCLSLVKEKSFICIHRSNILTTIRYISLYNAHHNQCIYAIKERWLSWLQPLITISNAGCISNALSRDSLQPMQH